jgi:hypothetical protein
VHISVKEPEDDSIPSRSRLRHSRLVFAHGTARFHRACQSPLLLWAYFSFSAYVLVLNRVESLERAG